jgi:molybdenum cofactor cytidylyltransferase
MKDKSLAGIILASGLSSRFKSNKLIHRMKDGKLLFEHSLINAINADIFNEIIVVTSYDEITNITSQYPFVKTIQNMNNIEGISESIKLGVGKVSDYIDGYMFIMADQPYIKSVTFQDIANAFKETDKIIIPQYKDTFGSPKVFPKKYKDELLKLSGDNGGRDVIKEHKNDVFIVNIISEIDNKDIDYQDDLGSD